MTGHKSSLNEFQMTETTPNIISNYDIRKLEINPMVN